MSIFRLSLITVGALGAAMVHFGRDHDLPADRIGREVTIVQTTIEPIATDSSTQTEPNATPNNIPAVTLVSFEGATNDAQLGTQAELSNEAEQMISAQTEQQTATTAYDTPSAVNRFVVSGSSVNMRSGPSTTHDILEKLSLGTQVFELNASLDGWSQVKIVDTGVIGFMASRFLKTQL